MSRTREAVTVLDHGYVQYVEHWGSDERIIEAARMSTGKGFQGWGPVHAEGCIAGVELTAHGDPDKVFGKCTCTPTPGDEKLLRFLWEHQHHTPFEMAGLTIEVQAPIFVFREWHRHRTQSYNEMSSRYTPLPDLTYLPSIERLMAGRQAIKNKQGSAEGFHAADVDVIRKELDYAYTMTRSAYEKMLTRGVARELARMVLPVAQYSRMRASANLRNWLHFLELRMADGAQWEIRQYADAVGKFINDLFPRTFNLFSEKDSR